MKEKISSLPITEELDFHYLLELMPPLHNEPLYTDLPELFSILGHEKLLLLSRYAGGEIIKIPTLDELRISIESLQWYYDVRISKKKSVKDVPKDILPYFQIIEKVYKEDASNHKE